jgi:vacuolar-type H+-ATPase subunit I/STV1
MKNLKAFGQKVWNVVRNPVGYAAMALAFVLGFIASTGIAKADDISDAVTSVGGYVTSATVIGVAVLLFVLGRKVVRKLIAIAFILAGFGLSAHATAPTDIPGVTDAVSGYVTAATVIGVAVLLFVLGRKVVRKLI